VFWIWWLVGFAVWFVVIFVESVMHSYQHDFLIRRKKWLMGQPAPQSRVVLVEFLPPIVEDPVTGEEKNMEWNDETMKSFFEGLFPGQVEETYVVKKASGLISLVDSWCDISYGLCEEEKKDNSDLADLETKITTAQEDFKRDRAILSAPHGFVTFKKNTQREAALNQRISDTDGDFVMSYPPLPQDVIWEDLETDATRRFIDDRLGDACIVGLAFAFMPIVLGISKITNIHNLEEIGFIKSILKSSGYEHTIGGLMASLGLTFMMSFLPTFLMLAFGFYSLKSNQWKQLDLQKLYFWFNVVFVLLVTAVGSNLGETLETIAESPFSVFGLLANRMPLTTHFYMCYIIMQPLTHGMNLTRYINVIKYFIWKKCCGYPEPEDARFKAEPEDQDYYGIGSRSARFAFVLLVGIVFGTICPLMNLLVLFNFCAMRTVYGYLIPCVEVRKNDLGGDHWCTSLVHLSCAMLIYIVLMVGILVKRAESYGPGGVAAASFLLWAVMHYKLTTKHWESLALNDVVALQDGKFELRKSYGKYSQYLDEVYLSTDKKVWIEHFKK
jgi:hypothetical protein